MPSPEPRKPSPNHFLLATAVAVAGLAALWMIPSGRAPAQGTRQGAPTTLPAYTAPAAPAPAPAVAQGITDKTSPTAPATSSSAPAPLPDMQGKMLGAMKDMMEHGTIAPMLAKVVPAVVAIRVKGLTAVEPSPLHSHPIFGRMVQDEMKSEDSWQRPFVSSGSGVIVDAARGQILTNNHVVEKATEIKVKLTDGREVVGKLVGKDGATDVAAVQIESSGLTAIPFGDSGRLRVGDFVVAIGNPLGLDSTATMGMISSLMRSNVGWRDFEAYIQHDAAVNSGNSGGALVNMKGELIGVNTAILSPSGGNVGLGFAIPIGMAQKVLDQLVKYGKVRRGTTGIRAADITDESRKQYGITALRGAVVVAVQKNSPAEKAGVKVGDVITAINGQPIASASQARVAQVVAEVGQVGRIDLDRRGEIMYADVAIADIKPDRQELEVPASIIRFAGLRVATLEEDSPFFGEIRGVEVIEVKKGTFPELVGFVVGDIITAIETDKVRRLDDIVTLTKSRNDKFDVHVMRKGVPVVVRYPL